MFADGTHTLVAVSRDADTNYATSSVVSFTIDNTPPTVSAVASSTTAHSATISWTTNEPATGQVAYGLTSSYGTLTPLTSSLLTAHQFTITGLTPSSTYHFAVAGVDGQGNTATSTDYTFVTPAVPDTTPPLVAVTAPTSGATVSGSSVSLTASSSDNVAVAGVTFYINGTKIGSQVTSSTTLFSTTWNSTATSSGSYALVAVSVDTSNNYATSSPVSFTVTNPGPTISAISSGTPGQTSATITWTTNTASNATVNYGTTTSYGTASSTVGLATSHSITLSGLTPSTLYHFQVQSTDVFNNTSTSTDQTFTTAALPVVPPTVTAQAATNVATSTATLNGTVTAAGTASSTIEGFNYGLTTSYGSVASSTGTFGAGSFSQNISGLSPGTTYHYQAFATSGAGTGTSSDQTFTTSAVVAPTVTTQAATLVSTSTAFLNGTITADGNASSTVRGFNLGLTTNYTASTTHAGMWGVGAFGTTTVGLTPATIYHYRAYATNSAGTGYGNDQTFTTSAAADTIPPLVALTAPTASSTVSGSAVTLTASSTDNVAVAGVTFYINGTQIGSQVTSSTTIFSTTWDSTATSSGVYTITAVSQDTSNNYATSSPVSFTVSNGSAPVISAISGGYPTSTSTTITWTTNASSTSVVNYGTTTAYGTASSSALLTTLHSITLTGLTASTTYDFLVTSTANGQTATSSNQTFVTTPTINPAVLAFGDSRTANGGGIAIHTAGASYTSSALIANDYSGCVPFETSNDVYYEPEWNFGVGAQSTAGMASRYSTASTATSGGTASSYVGSGGVPTVSDNEFNILSNSAYSSLTDPSNAIMFLGGVNDANIGGSSSTPELQSMLNITTLLNAWRQAGKVVFLANELPTGVAIDADESFTVPAGGGSYTTPHASTYYTDGSVIYAPTPGGTNDGVKLTNVGSSTPSLGQYSISNGVYTFSAADAGATVTVTYFYISQSHLSVGNTALHNWLSSTAADFVDPSSGIDYGIPGALYNRSWVVPVDTWDAIADPAHASMSYNLPYTLYDGLHPSYYGCQLVAKTFANAIKARVPATDYSNAPTGDTELLVTTNGVASSFSSTTTSPAAKPFAFTPITPGTFNLTEGTTTGIDNGVGGITGTGIATGTINYTTGAWTVTFTSVPANNTKIYGSTDPQSLVANGAFLPAEGFTSVASITGCSTACGTSGNIISSNNTGIPSRWISSIDSNTSTQIASGTMKLNFALSTTTSDTYPEMEVQMSGKTSSAGSMSVTVTESAISNLVANQKYRSFAVIKVDPGPNGQLYGLSSIIVKAACTPGASTSFTPVGETAVFSNGASSPVYSATAGAGGTGLYFTSADVASGELRIPILSQSCDTTGMSGTLTGSMSVVISTTAGIPISATVHISRASLKPYSY